MCTVRLISVVSLSAACAVSATALVGCSAADRLLYKHATDRYGDRTDFTEHSVIDAEWVPADATEITVRRSIVSGDAVVLLRSSSDLHMQCIEVERMTAPLWFLDGAPAVYDLEILSSSAMTGGWRRLTQVMVGTAGLLTRQMRRRRRVYPATRKRRDIAAASVGDPTPRARTPAT